MPTISFVLSIRHLPHLHIVCRPSGLGIHTPQSSAATVSWAMIWFARLWLHLSPTVVWGPAQSPCKGPPDTALPLRTSFIQMIVFVVSWASATELARDGGGISHEVSWFLCWRGIAICGGGETVLALICCDSYRILLITQFLHASNTSRCR